MLEEFLFKKVEVWIVLLLAVIGLVGTLLFGWGVRQHVANGRLGKFGEILNSFALIPTNAKRIIVAEIIGKSELEAAEQRFGDESGFKFSYRPGQRPDLGYLLLNRYDGDLKLSVSELVDLNAQETIHQWRFSVDALWRQSSLKTALSDLAADQAADRFRNLHGFLLADGSVVGMNFSPLVKADLCSNLSFLKDDALYHHSIEMDGGGNLWIPKHIEPKTVSIGTERFQDDGISQISPDGSLLFEKSIASLLDDNGLGYLVYGLGKSYDDPIHLNDIEPVLADGPFWRKGDVFLSIRHQSMILLYRPGTGEIVWYQAGPWVHQHDVDILDDHRIAIFNNNAKAIRHHEQNIDGANNELVFDFRTGTLGSPFEEAFTALDIRTIWEGRGKIQDSGEIFVEETEHGRLLQFNSRAEIIWQYVNRASDHKVYTLNWSRLIPRALGDRVR